MELKVNKKFKDENLTFELGIMRKGEMYESSNSLVIYSTSGWFEKVKSIERLSSKSLDELDSNFKPHVENYMTELEILNSEIKIKDTEDIELKIKIENIVKLDSQTKALLCVEFLNIEKDEWLSTSKLLPNESIPNWLTVNETVHQDDIYHFYNKKFGDFLLFKSYSRLPLSDGKEMGIENIISCTLSNTLNVKIPTNQGELLIISYIRCDFGNMDFKLSSATLKNSEAFLNNKPLGYVDIENIYGFLEI